MSQADPAGQADPRRERQRGARSRARKHALDLLYAAELRAESPLEGLRRADEEGQVPPRAYTATLVRGVVDQQARIDALLRDYSQGWILERMPAVDRNVLRLGVWELLFGEDVPDHVALAEAVALVRDLSTDESPVFVNGVLGSIARDRVSASDLVVPLDEPPAAG